MLRYARPFGGAFPYSRPAPGGLLRHFKPSKGGSPARLGHSSPRGESWPPGWKSQGRGVISTSNPELCCGSIDRAEMLQPSQSCPAVGRFWAISLPPLARRKHLLLFPSRRTTGCASSSGSPERGNPRALDLCRSPFRLVERCRERLPAVAGVRLGLRPNFVVTFYNEGTNSGYVHETVNHSPVGPTGLSGD